MKSTLIALTLSSISASSFSSSSHEELKQLFENFKISHNKRYSTMEEEFNRYEIFLQTLKVIDERNQLDSGIHGITQFADMTQEEFESIYLDRTIANKIRERNATITTIEPYQGVAASVDYTGKQTTAIKNQQNCGSCW